MMRTLLLLTCDLSHIFLLLLDEDLQLSPQVLVGPILMSGF